MKTVLVLAQHPEFAAAIAAGLNREQYRVVQRVDLRDAEPLLQPGLVDACVMDVEFSGIHGVWSIERLRQLRPDCPVVVCTGAAPWEWTEDAYLQGAAHVLAKPVNARLLETLLQRLSGRSAPEPGHPRMPSGSPRAGAPGTLTHYAPGPPSPLPAGATPPPPSDVRAIERLRAASSLLPQAMDQEELLRQFLAALRETFGVHRAMVFLRAPAGAGSTNDADAAGAAGASSTLQCAAALGSHAETVSAPGLSLDAGLGAWLAREGRLLRCDSPEALRDPELSAPLQTLGAQFAFPIPDGERVRGMVAISGRLTGVRLADPELEAIGLALEDLGRALRNIDQHRAMLASQELMARVLRELNTACVVVSSGLGILHANRAALQLFAAPGRRRAGLDFADLPQALGAKVYQVLKTGTGLSAFRHQPDDAPDASYRVSVLPLHTTAQAPPSAALLLVEDLTQTEQLSRLELEASGLRLVQSMAERLAHEIGNAIVPLSTHQQLLQQKYEDPEFRASLAAAMSDSVKRISRLAKQMFFLARERFERSDQVPVKQLVEEAFNDAQNLCAHKLARLQFENGSDPLALAVDHAGVRYALAEVLLNALQAGSGDAPVSVHASPKRDAHGTPWIDIAVRDSGPGFTAADATRATTPFFTTRSVGLGLGLTVARRIIEKHQGTIDIAPSGKEQPSQVVISLPAKS